MMFGILQNLNDFSNTLITIRLKMFNGVLLQIGMRYSGKMQ